jgi:DNA repair exonuclease SbcCD nuclease subunit
MSGRPFTLLHCADLHLDAVLGDSVGKSQLEEISLEDRRILRDAPLLALENIARTAIDRQVDLVVIAGDVFNRRDGASSDIRTRSMFTQFLRQLSDVNIHVAIALGNHDPLGTITELTSSWPEHVHLFSQRAPETIRLRCGEHDVAVHGMSYSTYDESRNLVSMFPHYVEGAINIGVLHTNVDGDSNHANYAPAGVNELVARGYEYFALGHVHKRTIVSEHPFIAYSGNSQGLSAKPSECESKGCLIATIDGPHSDVHHEFIASDVVRYVRHQIHVQQTHDDDIAMSVARELETNFRDAPFYLCRVHVVFDSETSISNETLIDMINEQCSRHFVTQLTSAGLSRSMDELFRDDEFFSLIHSEIENSSMSLTDLYGKKADAVAAVLGDKISTTDHDTDEVQQFIYQTYQQLAKSK